jgi:hypothetical protein
MSTTTAILASGEADSALTLATWVLVIATAANVLIDQHIAHGIAVVHHAHMAAWRAAFTVARDVAAGCVRCGLTIRRNFQDHPLLGYASPFLA